MNKDQKKRRRAELRRLQKQREMAKLQDLEEEVEEDGLEIPAVEPVEKEEDIEKCGEMAYVEPQPGPTSFDELDAMRLAEEQAHAVREVTWDTEMLVRNILRAEELDPDEKVEAISDVADEFAARVRTEAEDMEMQKDIELLELEALVAQDRRSISALEYLGDLTKAVLSSAQRTALSDEKFALVVTRDGKKVRKYPLNDAAHVRNAMARAAQMMKRGGQAASDAKAAMPKIRAAAKKMGIGASMEKEKSAILIEKDADNQWRWVGWASNNFIDWHNDIISEAAHKEYVQWWEMNKELSPVFDTWHIAGTRREHPADFVMYENGFLIMSGLLTEREAANLLEVKKEVDIGMSIQAFGFGRDPEDERVITKYRMYAVTDLPLDKAANPFVDFETITKEVGMDKLAYLTKILGSEEKAKAFLEKTVTKQEELQAAGVESKEKETPPAEPETKTETPAAPAPAVPATPAPGSFEELMEKIVKEMDIEALNAFVAQAKEDHEKVGALEEVVKSLQTSQDEELAKQLTPKASRFAWASGNRASQADATLLGKDDKELKKEKPGVPDGYWLSEATRTAPVKAE